MANLKDITKKIKKDAMKNKLKLAIIHATTTMAVLVIKLLPLILLMALVSHVLFNRQKEINQYKATPSVLYDVLGSNELGDLIEIKGNDTSGYYWGFKDDVDEKLDEAIKKLKKNHSTVTIESKELLKKMILAQLVTQYPDLGGKTFLNSNNTGGDSSVCELLLSQVNTPYIVGGESLDEGGFDCSGLIVWAYQQAGYDWGGARETANGFSKIGRQITREELQPGDLICEGWSGEKYGHIVAYIGDNQVVGAEAICSLAWNKHTVGACKSGCCVRKREMSQEEADGSNNVKYITLADYYKGSKVNIETTEQKDKKDVKEDNDNFQGAVHLRRVTPNKDAGELKDVSTGVTTQKGTYVQANSEGLGTKEEVPDSIQEKMKGKSMPDDATISYDELSYLTIPYFDFNGLEQKGHMIVRNELADEVLLIFQELYNIKYPIYKMEIIDNYKGTGDDLDWNSIEDNNTSAFCYRNSTGGNSVSKHGLGQAIDINPLINPYVTKEGEKSSHDVSNDCNYISRNVSTWKDYADKWTLDNAKEANINTDTEIYKIFKKYGWTWGGDWDSPKDYQHFEKEDITDVAHITSRKVNDSNENNNDSNNNSDEKIAGDGKEYVVAIDAGHGPSPSGGGYKTGTEDSSGLNTGLVEWQETRKVADAVADKLSIYSNLKVVRIGNSAEHESVSNSERVNMAKELGADLYITIHYNGSDDKSVSGTEVYYPQENGLPEDTASMQLAQILAQSVSSSIGTTNRGIHNEYYASGGTGLVIIKHSNLVGFPCVCVEGRIYVFSKRC